MPFDAPGSIEPHRPVTALALATTCLGGVVIAVAIGILLYAFVRWVAA